ncbi:Rha family transcriptional regulator [Paenibacillus amylolyticus]|uniref:Rha family transcriptional regulator n=1 Tax=Paenibacillus amylolyticus TaxID=1451 RepID=UPI003EBC5805
MITEQQLVFIDNGRVLTDSLTVADVFGKDHAKVLRDIRELDCSEEFNESNFGLISYEDSRGRAKPKYVLTQDGFTFLAMGYTGREAARFKEAYIRQFNHMRQQLQQLSTPSYAIDDPIARAKRWIQEREETERIETERLLLAEKVTEQAPKVEAFDTFISADGLQTMGDVAKSLGWGRNRLYAELRARDVLMNGNKPYQRFVSGGYFTVKQTVKGSDEVKFTLPVTMVTAKGVAYIERLLAS